MILLCYLSQLMKVIFNLFLGFDTKAFIKDCITALYESETFLALIWKCKERDVTKIVGHIGMSYISTQLKFIFIQQICNSKY